MRAQPVKPTAKKNGAPKSNAKKSTPSKPITKKKANQNITGKTKAIAKKLVVQSHLKKKPPKLNPAKKDPDEPKSNDKPADSSKPTTAKSPHSTRSNSPVKKSKSEKKPKPKKVLTSPKKKTKPAVKKNKPIKSAKKRTPSPLKDTSIEATPDKAGDNTNDNKIESMSLKGNESKSNTKEKKTGKKIASKKAIVLNDSKASTVPVDQTSIKLNVDETTTVAVVEDPAVDPVKKSQKSVVEPSTNVAPPKINVPNLQNINDDDTKTKVNPQPNIPTLKSPKTENERPPKFFTSHRQGKIIDIDQKINVPKNMKIALAPTEKSTDNKNDEFNKNTRSEKGSNEPEIDVYTFTDYKVDSPNSILTEFRNPLGRKIGRVRPIARVKGTIIDKNKLEAERKKVSPHRAPDDIVKHDGTKVSKSNKKPDELKTPTSQDDSNVTSESGTENEVATTSANYDKPLIKKSEVASDDKTKKIVSKSYKMVSRKSTMFKKKFADVFGGAHSKSLARRDVKSDDSSSSDKPCSSFVNRNKPKGEVKVFKKVKPIGSCAISKKPKIFKKAPKKIVHSHKNKVTKKQKFDEDFDHSTFSLNVDNSHETESPKSAVPEKKTQKKDSVEIKAKEIHDHESKSEADDEKSAKDTSDESDYSVRSEDKSYTFNLPSTSKGSKKYISSDDSNPSKRRLKLFSLWTGPKRHRMASLNAIAKVHCLYENESRTHLELGLMKTVERNLPTKLKDVAKKKPSKVEKRELSTSESDYEKRFKGELESSEEESVPPTRNLRNVPGARGSGKYWDHKSSTSSSEDSEVDFIKQIAEKKKPAPKTPAPAKVDGDKPAPKAKKIVGAPAKPRRKRDEATMDLRDMVVKKRMASLNATAILAASYEKRSSKSSKEETTSDSSSGKDETYSKKTKNGSGSGSKEKAGTSDDGSKTPGAKQKVEVIVNQDTDVTITGVYSTHHEGFCTVSGMQYRISSTSHTQTTATASGDQESTGPEEGGPYTPLGALSSMQPPAEQVARDPLHHPTPVQEPRGLGSLGRRAGSSSAFSAPPPSNHDSGYYQPAGPLIKESGARADPDERRALARYHPPHYHHQQMVPQYGGPAYYPAELCYAGRYYRPPAPPAYAPPPAQPEPQMVGVGGEFAPPPQYYAPPPPCYQHPPQRPLPYLEYPSCPCPMQTCPKNVLIGPAIGNPPTSGGPVTSSEAAGAAAGGAFPVKAKARGKGSLCRADDKRKGKTSSGKDPPRGACRPPEHYPPAVAINNPAPGVVPPEALGPPSPARASAGACLPHPPDRTVEPAGDRAHPAHPAAADERVECKREGAAAAAGDAALLADLQTDIKKENSEPDAESPSRKSGSVLTETQALREHHADNVAPAAPAEPSLKPTKRRRSQPKLEIELDRALLEDAHVDGMGDRIKLHKRQKIEQRKPPTGTYKDLINASIKPVRLNNGKKQLNVPKHKQSVKSLEAKIERKVEAKAEVKAEAEAEAEAKAKAKTKGDAKADAKAEAEAKEKADAKAETKAEAKVEAKAEAKADAKVEPKAETKVEAKAETKVEAKAETKVEAKAETKVEAKAEAKVENRKTNKRKNSTPPDGSPAKRKRTDENASTTESEREPARPRNKSAILLDKLLMKNHVDHVIESVVKNFAIPAEPSPAALFGSPEAVATPPAIEIGSVDAECKAVKPNKVLNINNNIIDKLEGAVESATGRRKRSVERTRAEPEGERRARSGSLKESAAEEGGVTKESKCADQEAGGEGKCPRRAGKPRRGTAGKRKSKSRSAERPPADWCVAAAAHAPRWSNGWLWEGEPYTSKVFLNNDESGVRRCWAGMRHALAGDRVRRGDCVLLRAAARRGSELPFVARVARLWENPNDGEMMVSLVWYYRPEHTERGRVASDAPDEVFASRHRDANSVACIEDKCYVLTFNEYCRYRKRLKAAEEGIAPPPSIVPAMPAAAVPPGAATNDARLPPSVSPDLVLFCRKVYDFRSKKIQIPNK